MLAIASCKKKSIEFHRLELPGFSIEVPTFVKAPVKPEYRAGDVQRQQFPGNIEVPTAISVSWQPGAIMTVEELPATARVLLAEFVPKGTKTTFGAARTVTVGGQTATQLDAKLATVDALFIDITCGKRTVMITIATVEHFTTIRDRMLKSFVCKPVEADEAALDSLVAVGADDPKTFDGWRYADTDHSVVNITNGEMVVVFAETQKPDGIELDTFRKVLPQLFGASGATFTPDTDGRETRTLAGGERRQFERGKVTIEGETVAAVLSLWACPDGKRAVFGFAMIVLPEIPASKAIDFITKVRCGKVGDPPLPVGPYEAVEEEKPE